MLKSEKSTSPDNRLVEHFFRHEYSRLVAVLTRRVGVGELELIEDAAQSALLAALEKWPASGPPEHAFAWLYRVAHNRIVSELRGAARRREILQQHGLDPLAQEVESRSPEPNEIRDDLLRRLFVCCEPSIPEHSQLVLALKTLCGFGVSEIALRLFSTEANVYKRLQRARRKLRELKPFPAELTQREYANRLPAVQRILYLLFTEGYLSGRAEHAIRSELCNESLRLGHILVEHPIGQKPESFALIALMHLHKARLSARTDGSGGLLLLEEQVRQKWDKREIYCGLQWLSRAAAGESISSYHIEAGIAAEHCLAATFAETNWEKVVSYYRLLERLSESPLHTLNRAVATAEWKGPEHALSILEESETPRWLTGSFLWSAVLSDLHRRCGNVDLAENYRTQALERAPTKAVYALLSRRLSAHSA